MMNSLTLDLVEPLEALSRARDVDAVRAADELFDRLKKAEAAHIEEGLRDPRFPFDDAQRALAARFRSFGRIVQEIRTRLDAGLGPAERRRLGELALIGASARLTGTADLQAIRHAHARRARMTTV